MLFGPFQDILNTAHTDFGAGADLPDKLDDQALALTFYPSSDAQAFFLQLLMNFRPNR